MISVGEDIIFDVNQSNHLIQFAHYNKAIYHYPNYFKIRCNSEDILKIKLREYPYSEYKLYGEIVPGEYCRLKPARHRDNCSFNGQQSITGIDLRYWNIGNLVDRPYFSAYNCSNLQEVIFDDSSGCLFGSSAFRNTAIKEITLPKNSVINTVGDVNLFENCLNLEYADISGANVVGSFSTYYMFHNCPKLKTIKADNPTTLNQSSIVSVSFQGCSSLKELDLTQLVYVEPDTYYPYPRFNGAFRDCSNLEFIDMSSIYKISTNNMGTNLTHPFKGCTALKKIRCGSVLTGCLRDSVWAKDSFPENWSNIEWEIVGK